MEKKVISYTIDYLRYEKEHKGEEITPETQRDWINSSIKHFENSSDEEIINFFDLPRKYKKIKNRKVYCDEKSIHVVQTLLMCDIILEYEGEE